MKCEFPKCDEIGTVYFKMLVPDDNVLCHCERHFGRLLDNEELITEKEYKRFKGMEMLK